jgi:hypothetical protein
MSKIYQLVSFANGYNKRTKKWESLRSISNVYVGPEGLKTAYFELEKEQKEIVFLEQYEGGRKYREIRGKVEIQIPHVHENGSLAYWGDKVLKSYNPKNI